MASSQQIKQARAALALRAERSMGINSVPRVRAARAVVPGASAPATTKTVAAKVVAMPARPQSTVPTPKATPVVLNLKPLDFTPIAKEEKLRLLTALDETQVKGCTKCVLCRTRTNTVFADGDPGSELMFIGEAPGENEDLSGKPFVGKAGQLLDKMIVAMGLSRDRVYIANVVKCRPPDNRPPSPEETAACSPYLYQQIEWVRPKVIVTLGLPATQLILNTKQAMGKMRGVWHEWRGVRVMPTYHPAYVLRSYTEQTRRAVWSDLQMVMTELSSMNPPKEHA